MPSRRQLGQYFTPPPVVDLAYAVLRWLQPDVSRGRLVDPSCGEGAFLTGALRAGFAPERLYGTDADPALALLWRAHGLRQTHGPRLAICDGLLGGGEGQFDVVAGNPPYAGSIALPAALTTVGRYRWGGLVRQRQTPPQLPRELWFLERSLRLLRRGGLLALVLPEGVFANRRWYAVRQALLAETQVEAIIGLPRATFRASRTTVKTCLLVARRHPPSPAHQVRLAELTTEEVARGADSLVAVWGMEQTVADRAPWEQRRHQ